MPSRFALASRLSAVALVSALLVGASSTQAQAPALLPIQGYLTGADNALLQDGSYTIRFRLYDSADPMVTAALHDEVLEVSVVAGYFTVYLGDTANGGTALDLSLFRDEPTVYLGFKVGVDPEATPRLQLATAAFAAVANYCGEAETLGGIEPSGFATASHTHPWSQLTSVPAGFADGVDHDTTYTAGSGLALSGGAFSLSTSGCTAGEVWKYNGTSWSCEPDANTSTPYTAGSGLALNGGAFSLSTSGCTAGEVWKYNGASWSCEPDANTTYSGTSFATSNQSCSGSQKVTGIGATGAVTCGADLSADGDISSVTAGRGLSGGGTSGAVTLNVSLGVHRVSCPPTEVRTFYDCACPSGEVAIGGGGYVVNSTRGSLRESWQPGGGGWRVGCIDLSGNAIQCSGVYAICAVVQ